MKVGVFGLTSVFSFGKTRSDVDYVMNLNIFKSSCLSLLFVSASYPSFTRLDMSVLLL